MYSGTNSDVLNSNGKTAEDVAFENAHVSCVTRIHEIKCQLTKKREKAERLKQGNSKC